MSLRHALWQIGEELGNLSFKAHPGAGGGDPFLVLATGLLSKTNARPLLRAQERERRRDDVGHHARALRPTGHEEL